MKNIFLIFFFIFGITFCNAQILIGTATASSPSVSLEFGTQLRGILLEPIDLPVTANAGTVVFDDDSGSLRYFNGTTWSAPKPGGLTNTVTSYTAPGNVIINGSESTADGVFIIEDTNKAMVLPVIPSGSLKIKNPTIGLIYYDSFVKALMVYNGNSWDAF
ncbi:hypothetical protein CW736_02815 [Nonlabens sp. MB-3u-79]|uniref:hypothetical protein n=1 Tax=Nonlabens sp. MB-3u-79 TaxID=2058134 RepID=UPI000C30E14A|nr:hypothetical protein [Nonlabens sp. MB-3u-79]AUC78394.1 hypothetical protein CW736_02815 [Nonlabens sp. MB-3u-79]|tara:strand:- start:33073 stop:33555 length:483 start_codon:yes stop_codon:yes gene_type:complete